MRSEVDNPLPLVEWSVATLPLRGQAESGDGHLVQPFPDGVLMAAVDGLGHGNMAGCAAKIAVETLKDYAHESVLLLIKRCHERLRGTRGAVMSLASFNALDGTMTWLGVGNVEGLLLRVDSNANPARECVLLRGGVVGYQLPSVRTSVIPLTRGDMLIFTTNGISSCFAQGLSLIDPPQQIADRILARYGKDTDDALVLVARFLGATL